MNRQEKQQDIKNISDTTIELEPTKILSQGQYLYCLQIERKILIDVEVYADSKEEAIAKYHANDTSKQEEITDSSDIEIYNIIQEEKR